MPRPKTRIPLSVRNAMSARRNGRTWLDSDGRMLVSPEDVNTIAMFSTPLIEAMLDDGFDTIYRASWTVHSASMCLEIPVYVLNRFSFDMFEFSTKIKRTKDGLPEVVYYPIAVMRKLRRVVEKSGMGVDEWLTNQREAKRNYNTAKLTKERLELEKHVEDLQARLHLAQRQLNTTLAVLDKLTRNRDDHRAKITAVLAKQGLTLPDATLEQQTEPATSEVTL